MATPHVAGAWAVAKQANPGASVSDVLAGLQNTGRLITDVNDVVTPRIAATMLQFSAPTYSVVETGGNAVITVTRAGSMFGPNLAPLTIDYATSAGTAIPGQDYTEKSGTLEFNQGDASKTFTVPVNDNTVDNSPKTVNLTLTNPGGGAFLGVRDVAVLTIGDNDVPGTIQLSSTTYSANENAGTATITVTRSGGNASPVTVQYATSDGTGHAGEDYQAATGTLTFDASGPGAMTQTFTVTILNNGLPEENRTVNLTLHTPSPGATLGAKKTAVLTIVDDEIALQFSQASYSVKESAGSATITVTRTGPKEPPVEVTYTVLGGSATQGADYGGIYTGLLEFAANETSKTFKVTILNDTLAEGAETVLLRLSDPTGAILGNRPTAALTILDNDPAGSFKFSAASYSVNEGVPTLTVTVTRLGGTGGGVSVSYLVDPADPGTATEGVDFTLPDPHTLEFAAFDQEPHVRDHHQPRRRCRARRDHPAQAAGPRERRHDRPDDDHHRRRRPPGHVPVLRADLQRQRGAAPRPSSPSRASGSTTGTATRGVRGRLRHRGNVRRRGRGLRGHHCHSSSRAGLADRAGRDLSGRRSRSAAADIQGAPDEPADRLRARSERGGDRHDRRRHRPVRRSAVRRRRGRHLGHPPGDAYRLDGDPSVRVLFDHTGLGRRGIGRLQHGLRLPPHPRRHHRLRRWPVLEDHFDPSVQGQRVRRGRRDVQRHAGVPLRAWRWALPRRRKW